MFLRIMIGGAALLTSTTYSAAQVPVIDNANLQQSTKTAEQTRQILETDKQTLEKVNETLQAVTGARQDGSSLSQLAVGQGYSVGQAPSLGSLLTGSSLSWGSMGSTFATGASTFINGLSLIKSLSGDTTTPIAADQSYSAMVNSVAAISAMVNGAGAATQARMAAFQGAASQVGQSQDVKGSLDQNTQVQIQSGLTMNEAIGTLNAAVSALNAQNLQTITMQAGAAEAMQYDPQYNWMTGEGGRDRKKKHNVNDPHGDESDKPGS
jgi:hypothetical protein